MAESGDLYDDPDFRAYARRVRTELLPKIEQSMCTLSIVPEGETDVKFAVELGLSIMLDKPIIAVVRPGVKIPNKLALVADRIVEGDITTGDGAAKLGESLAATLASMRATDR